MIKLFVALASAVVLFGIVLLVSLLLARARRQAEGEQGGEQGVMTQAQKELVHPFMFRQWCQWHVSDNAKKSDNELFRTPAPMLTESNAHMITHADVVYVENSKFEHFANDILPHLQNSIILITGKWTLPSLERSDLTDDVLKDERILHWLSHNPIYEPSHKYRAIPYGVCYLNVDALYNEMQRDVVKSKEVAHMGLGLHYADEETKALRRNLIDIQDPRKPIATFYRELHESKAVICPAGDRQDTFRHSEAQLLGCVPIVSMPPQYNDWYPVTVAKHVSPDEMVRAARERSVENLPETSDLIRERFLQPFWRNFLHSLRQSHLRPLKD